MKTRIATCLVLMFASVPAARSAQSPGQGGADAYPTKPIRLLVPQAPGGSNDIMARYFGGQLAARTG